MAGSPWFSSRLNAARTSTYVVFFTAGALQMSWASRIPQVRDGLGLDPGKLGLLLLVSSAGSLAALLVAGPVIGRIGSASAVSVFTLVTATGMTVVGLGYLVGVPIVAVGLFLNGVGIGIWDVAVNVQGSLVEQRLGEAIMPRFHAGYSVGTVFGALIGAAMVALNVPVTAHLVGAAILVAVANLVAARHFLSTPTSRSVGDALEADVNTSARSPSSQEDRPRKRYSVLDAWKEPRVILIGLFVMLIAFAEGAAVDWIGLGLIDGYGTVATVGTLGLATFLTAMTVARWFGTPLLDRFGRVPVLAALSLLLTAGAALFIFAPNPALAFVGALLWGTGASLGFPVGMSAAGDDPRKAAARVSVVATIGYGAFLGGASADRSLGRPLGCVARPDRGARRGAAFTAPSPLATEGDPGRLVPEVPARREVERDA